LVYGIGEAKLRDFGGQFLAAIAEHAGARGLAMDVQSAPPTRKPALSATQGPTPRQLAIFALFRQELAIEDVMHQSNLARSTVMDHLAGFIRHERPASIQTWVDDATYQRIAEVSRQVGADRLKPIFIALGESIDYDRIRIVLAHLQATQVDPTAG
jgi:ATP-dependent DNA helicase RecQ